MNNYNNNSTFHTIRDITVAITGCAACSYAIAKWPVAWEHALFAGTLGLTLVLWALYNRGLPLPMIFHQLGLLMFVCERACRVLGDMGARFPREFTGEFREVWGRLKEREQEEQRNLGKSSC